MTQERAVTDLRSTVPPTLPQGVNPAISAPMVQPLGEERTARQNRSTSAPTQPVTVIRTNNPVRSKPLRLVDTVRQTRTEQYTDTTLNNDKTETIHETHTYVPNYIDKSVLMAKHMPNQKQLNEMLRNLQAKVLKNYHLPYDKRETKLMQNVLCSLQKSMS